MSETITREKKFILSSVRGNNNKFYYISIRSDNTVHVLNGRVGGNGQTQKPRTFADADSADRFFISKCNEKENKGYKPLQVVDGSSGAHEISQSQLETVAKEEIDTGDCPVTAKLIKYFVEVNRHKIISNTTISYDVTSGTFSTPCGVVTNEALDIARKLLTKITIFVKKKDFRNNQYIDILDEYLMLIPQKVGNKLDPYTLYPDVDSVSAQSDIIDSLEASIQNTSVDTKHEKTFEVNVEILDDKKEKSRINKYFKDTLSKSHACSYLKMKTVYAINIKLMKESFDVRASEIGNIHELFHGSRSSNILSILRSGLVIPPSSASHVTGRLFGAGIYFANRSTKSLNYSYGYWGGGVDKNCFMFLGDVAMGKSYVPTSGRRTPPKNYNSLYATAGKSGVINDEIVVYNTNQCNLKYLMEFS